MIIQHNLAAMNTNRQLGTTTGKKIKSTEKLSSGYKINRAADNSAGLSISEKMRSQVRGLSQASYNAQDGISLLQTADGALSEVHNLLQRMRELSVSAGNDTNVTVDRTAIQEELDALAKEVTRIGSDTEFNTKKILDGSCSSSGISQSEKNKFISWLNGSWLKDAALKIESSLGWTLESGTDLAVTFTKSNNSYIASMSGWYLGDSFTLDINTKYLTEGIPYNGTDGPTIGNIAADRVITHELVHQYMFDNVSTTAVPDNWFIEGLAEAVNGASNTRYSSYELYGNTDYSYINNGIQNFDFLGNQGGYDTYTVGYLATSYLYNQVESTLAGSFKTMLAEMDQTDETFRDLVVKYTPATTYSGFISGFKNAAQAAYVSPVANAFTDFLLTKCGINISDGLADPIGSSDATSSNIIPNTNTPTMPTAASTTLTIGSGSVVNIQWDADQIRQGITLQIGANSNQSMVISIDEISATALGLDNLSVSNHTNSSMSIKSCEDAIEAISAIRSNLGANQNRLEHVIANLDNTAENLQNAESRIRDVDMAKEMVAFSRSNILEQIGQSMLTQANQSSQGILSLLQ
jgi:flagellin